MLEYCVAKAPTLDDLCIEVMKLCEKRWKPQGGLYGSHGFAQAMIRNKCHHTSRQDDNTCQWCGDVIDANVNKS